ncbi:cell surface glycoprotein CD200 receptor 1-like [Suncus etruscus]|uniref:cell surface glycoprotein CD200 receptor 1-like n=1 Tax=Suncus etruscus TaxID=109475 RepID=UPI0021105D94|nr:cell surface glycoprotein CD200 receptor 1-like [Suncus etruscus]
MDRKKTCVKSPTEGHSYLTASVGTKVVLFCLPICSDYVMLATWGIDLGGKSNCNIAYHPEKNETNNTCGDKELTWFSRPDQNTSLQIDPVAVSHEGNYSCEIVTLDGNFHHYYHLQVLVAPVVTLSEKNNRTAECEAVGKPAAQISWTPECVCVTTEQKHWDNGTVKTQSTCQLEENNVASVSCSVFHLTGNTTKSIKLNQKKESSHTTKYIYLIAILIFMGFICFLIFYVCRKCKLKKRRASLITEEAEMQPYASYTEKNNPLYDTTDRAKTSQL